MSTDLRKLQQSFFDYLVKQPSDVDQFIRSTPERSAEQRLHIYSSGYRIRLKNAIKTDFERLFLYLGDALFEQLMDDYIDTYQSHHPSLRYFSQHLQALIKTHAPFNQHPEILELAKIEQAFNHSFDAADCSIMTLDSLTDIAAEDWGALTIQCHPSLQILTLQKNSFDIWQALANETEPDESIDFENAWIIWRKDLLSVYRSISKSESYVLDLAIQGHDFVDLCEAMSKFVEADQAPMKVMTFLRSWIKEGIVCHLS